MKISKILSSIGISFSVAVISTVAASAWGPERSTFTVENPATYPTFNSITNDPHIGDERNFVRIREVGAPKFVDSVDIVPGKEYEVQIYYHNNARSDLNAQGRGTALNSKIKATLPSVVKKGSKVDVSGEILSSNARPNRVFDHATINSPQRDVALRYVMGSANITSNGAINGMALDANRLFGEGHLIGYSALNGVLPGCYQYSGSVKFKFVADYADFNISKTVSKENANSFQESQDVNAGSIVDFKIHYKNTGTTTQNNVNIMDVLPKGMTYVAGSTKLFNNLLPNGKVLNDAVVTANGINIGDYRTGAEGYIIFKAKVAEEKDLICGVNTLTNTAHIRTNNGNKNDTATVNISKKCTPPQKDFCQVIGKTHLKKNDPKCFEPCQIKGKEHLKKDDPKCFEHCIVKGKEHLKKDDPKCNDPCPVKGKEHLKANDPNCYQPCEIKGKENLKSTDPNCSEPCQIKGKENLKSTDPLCGEIPAELPKTGPMEAAMMIIAMTALSGAVAYWFRSREEMKKITNLGAKKEIKTPEITPKKDK